jgi:xanthine/uracil/vitamin C permease (AzgA family)
MQHEREECLNGYSRFFRHNISVCTRFSAGPIHFVTMSFIIIVALQIPADTGMDKVESLIATIGPAASAALFMELRANFTIGLISGVSRDVGFINGEMAQAKQLGDDTQRPVGARDP